MTNSQYLKMAFVTINDALNLNTWSGTPYYMAKNFEKQSVQIDYIGPLIDNNSFSCKIKKFYIKYILKKNYIKHFEPIIYKNFAQQVSQKLSLLDVDIIFSYWPIPIANLECSQPIVLWTDATFGGLLNFYPEFSNFTNQTIRNGHIMEMSAIKRTRLAIYSSDWAAETAKIIYQTDDSKIKVVPYGANIECNRSIIDIRNILQNKDSNKCNLLFIGQDWVRKGGDIALEIAKRLNIQGLKTELTVVGCQPDIGREFSSFVKILGFIPKSSPEGRLKFEQLLAQSHFFILPTKAECYGIVFCEANSFGLPCLSFDVGGIPTIIRDGINGKLFQINGDIEDYCTYISNIFSKHSEYHDLCLSSFNEYETRLNWPASCKKVRDYLIDLI